MRSLLSIILFLTITIGTFSQSSNDVLNLLIANKSISQQQADSVRAEAALLQQTSDAARKTFPIIGTKSLALSGYAQVRYQVLDEYKKKDGFDIRRA
jgi:phosphate-selective porin OprO and OprP